MKEIKSAKIKVMDVFKNWYIVPSYQRHYVWEEDNINALLEDIKDNYLERNDEEYFLGSYIIQSKNDNNDLLDGQQRITTLFLLFAFLRDYERTENQYRSEFQDYIYQGAKPMSGIKERVRLTYEIRGNVKSFINEFIIPTNSIIDKWEAIKEKANDSKENISIQHMCRALLCFKKFFDENDTIDIVQYVTFINTNMVMIYISADTLEDAFRMFSIMNDRGVKLSNADILKSSNLEVISDKKDMESYAREWEELQADLGNDFDRFLSYVRTLYVKTKAKLGLLEEYNKNIFKTGKLKMGKDFFESIKSYYKIYNSIIQLDNNNNYEYCNLINVLNSGNLPTDWVPVIMSYYKKYKEQDLTAFAKKLACKAIADMVCGESPTKRIENLNKIMPAIEDSSNPAELLSNTHLFAFDKELFLNNIQTDVYRKSYAKTLLLMLEYMYQDNSILHTYSFVSIEHILPQNPSPNSQWCADYTDEERINNVDKIGNLCIIGRRKNTSLGNLDYQNKRKRYFEKNIGNFARTLHIYNKFPNSWLPTDLKHNTDDTLLDIRKLFGI